MLYEFTTHALKDKVELHFYILKGNEHFQHFLKAQNVEYTFLNFEADSIWSIFRFAFKLSKKLKGNHIVHTHYHDANLVGLIAALLARVPKRIYTRHHNAFHTKNFNWKTNFIKTIIDKASTSIIAPSKTVSDTLVNISKVDPAKVFVIHHPFDLAYLVEPNAGSIENLRRKYAISSSNFVVGAVSSFNTVKGTRKILEAFKIFSKEHPNTTLVLANAHGTDEQYFFNQVEDSNLDIVLIPYENDILSLYKTFDVIIHASVSLDSEAFGQVYIESMAMKIPGIFTLAGILPEIAQKEKNCIIVPYNDEEQIAMELLRLYKDPQLRKLIGENAKNTVSNSFNLEKYRSELMKIYE